MNISEEERNIGMQHRPIPLATVVLGHIQYIKSYYFIHRGPMCYAVCDGRSFKVKKKKKNSRWIFCFLNLY